MNELYSIKKETLTDIADALRAKYGDTEIATVEEYIPITLISKTPNATGFDSWSGNTEKNPDGTDRPNHIYMPYTIEGASSLKVKMAYHLYYMGSITSYHQYVYIASGNYDENTFPIDTALKYQGEDKTGAAPIKMVELDFPNTDTITIYWHGSTTGFGDYSNSFLGYYAEVTGYDSDGNLIGEIQTAEKEVARTYTSSEMAEAIDTLPPSPPEEAFVLTGDCSYKFANSGWDWFIELYGDKITTKDMTAAQYFLQYAKITKIPFELNFNADKEISMTQVFKNAELLTEIPKFNNCRPSSAQEIFSGCRSIREFPEDIDTWFDWSYIEAINSSYGGNMNGMFSSCNSLRKLPMGMLNHSNKNAGYSYSYLTSMCQYDYCLDEVLNVPINYTATWTSNALGATVGECYRLSGFTFAMPNGQPYVMNWKSQTFDFSSGVGYVGYAYGKPRVLDFNSGITADKEVTDDATYQALKDDPDWFTANIAYSRYNHDSAVATINSLPDTSVYLAEKGGTNTIKFKGAAGSATDGGAINTMSEEVIALAASKGWTVTFV